MLGFKLIHVSKRAIGHHILADEYLPCLHVNELVQKKDINPVELYLFYIKSLTFKTLMPEEDGHHFTLANAFSWMKIIVFYLRFHQSLFLRSKPHNVIIGSGKD